jgi:hypothetical protein
MDVIAGIVTRRMSIPPMVERSLVVCFVVVEREVPVFEPDDFQTSSLDVFGVEPGVVQTHQTVGSELGLRLDSGETVVGSQALSDGIESVEVDWRTTE